MPRFKNFLIIFDLTLAGILMLAMLIAGVLLFTALAHAASELAPAAPVPAIQPQDYPAPMPSECVGVECPSPGD